MCFPLVRLGYVTRSELTERDWENNPHIYFVLSFMNSLSRTSLYFSLKTSFVYSNLFSLAKTVTIRCYIQTSKRVRSPSSACKKAGNCLKLQSINHFTIAACGNVMEFHSVLLFIDPSRLILMDSVICLSIASPC